MRRDHRSIPFVVSACETNGMEVVEVYPRAHCKFGKGLVVVLAFSVVAQLSLAKAPATVAQSQATKEEGAAVAQLPAPHCWIVAQSAAGGAPLLLPSVTAVSVTHNNVTGTSNHIQAPRRLNRIEAVPGAWQS
jgi:hypothetical protein